MAEVIVSRTFARPTEPFVDGKVIKALAQADDAQEQQPVQATPKPQAQQQQGSGTQSQPRAGSDQSWHDAAPLSSSTAAPGRSIDVRV